MIELKPRKGFVIAPIAVLRSPLLSPEDKLLYFELCSWAWGKSTCFPKQSYLAKHLNCSKSSIKRRLRNLVTHGLIIVHDRRSSGKASIYELVSHIPPEICPRALLANNRSVLDYIVPDKVKVRSSAETSPAR